MLKNHGVILNDNLDGVSFLGGVGDALAEVNPSADWRRFVPTLERQYRNGLETYSCVSQSFTNAIETYLNYLGIEDNFSERDLARLSHTTPQGNTCHNVASAAINNGLSRSWGWDKSIDTWDEFYAEPSEETEISLRKERSDFLNKFDLHYPIYVGTSLDSIRQALKKAPVWATNSGHAFVITHVDGEKVYVNDSYPSRDGMGNGYYDISLADIRYAAIIPIFKKKLRMEEISIKDNTPVQLTEPGYPDSGMIGLYLNGKIWLDNECVDKMSRTWLVRTQGKGLTKRVWDALPKVDFKGNPIN